MKTSQYSSVESFQHGSYQLFRDIAGQLVTIPSSSELEGYLAVDRETRSFVQIRILRAGDDRRQERYCEDWSKFLGSGDGLFSPRMLALTDFDENPCYVSSVPLGEPVNQFLERNGTVPVEVAARLVLDFAVSLQEHDLLESEFAIAPESIWIARTESGPRIVLGEYASRDHEQPAAFNYALAVELLVFLAGGAGNHEGFARLINQLEDGPARLSRLESLLSDFVETNPCPNYWMGFNDPRSVQEGVIFPEEIATGDDEDSLIVRVTKKSVWPMVVLTTLFVGAFITFCLFKFSDLATSPPTVAVTSQNASSPFLKKTYTVSRSGPNTVSPVAISPSSQAVIPSNPVESTGKVEWTPYLKTLLGNTGDLFGDVLRSSVSEWLVFPEEDGSDELQSFNEEDEKALRVLELKRASTEAMASRAYITAVGHELEILSLRPDSVDARIRLHDCLTELRKEIPAGFGISDEDVEILVEAATENSLAKEIILKVHASRQS